MKVTLDKKFFRLCKTMAFAILSNILSFLGSDDVRLSVFILVLNLVCSECQDQHCTVYETCITSYSKAVNGCNATCNILIVITSKEQSNQICSSYVSNCHSYNGMSLLP